MDQLLTAEEKLIRYLHARKIDSIAKLNRFPDLDASLIRFIIGPIDINTAVKEYTPVDTTVCFNNSCPNFDNINLDNNAGYNTACAKCPYGNVKCKVRYINPKQKYKLYNSKRNRLSKQKIRFPKITIKLLLILQSWPTDLTKKVNTHDALLSSVYIPGIAKILGCTSDYLEDCLKELGNASILELDKIYPRTYNIIIPDFYKKYEKASAGGGGYIQINRDILQFLLKENHINALRGMLYQLLNNPLSDDDRAKRNYEVTFAEIRSFMPKYVNYKAEYVKALNNNLFAAKIYKADRGIIAYRLINDNSSIMDQKLELAKNNANKIVKLLETLDPSFITQDNSNHDDTNKDKNYKNIIDSIIKKIETSIPKFISKKDYLFNFFKDALMISLDYGYLNVTKSIIQIDKMHRYYGTAIKNAGALLRKQCCYNSLNGYV